MLSNQAHAALVAELQPKTAAATIERERYTRDDLKSRSARAKLPARGKGNKPFFIPLSDTVSLGYQLATRDGVAGKWIKREYVGKIAGVHKYRSGEIAIADDFDGAGIDIDAAVEVARGKLVAKGSVRVRDIVEQHKDFRGKRGDKVKRNRQKGFDSLRWHVLGLDSDGKAREGFDSSLADTMVEKLTTEQLTAWRNALADATCQSTAARTWNNLRSALHQAYKKTSNGIASAKAWEDVAKLPQKRNARLVHFSDERAVEIIEHVRHVSKDTAAADYFEGLYRTGARPGDELFALSVRDFNPVTRKLTIQGRTETSCSKTGERTIALDELGVALFVRLTEGREGHEPMFAELDGSRLSNKDMRRWKALLVAAGAPADAVAYSFRHTFISRRLERGMPSSLVATHCGTSTYMIETTYAKFIPSHVERWLNETAPKATPAKRLKLVA